MKIKKLYILPITVSIVILQIDTRVNIPYQWKMASDLNMEIREELRQLKKQVSLLEKAHDIQNSQIALLNRQLDSMMRPMRTSRQGKNGDKPMIQDLLDRLQAFPENGISAAEMIRLVDGMGYKPASVRASLNNARKVGQVRFIDGRYYPLGVKQFEF